MCLANYEPIECMGCDSPAVIKDYRERNQIIDGYPACKKHFNMDDGNFWKAVKRKANRSVNYENT